MQMSSVSKLHCAVWLNNTPSLNMCPVTAGWAKRHIKVPETQIQPMARVTPGHLISGVRGPCVSHIKSPGACWPVTAKATIPGMSCEHLRIQEGQGGKISARPLHVCWTKFACTYGAVLEVDGSLYRWKVICIRATGWSLNCRFYTAVPHTDQSE